MKQRFLLRHWYLYSALFAVCSGAGVAMAVDTIYHAGTDCQKTATYTPTADLAVRDGHGVGEKQVKGANLEGESPLSGLENVTIPLQIPSSKYVSTRNADMSHSFIEAGTLSIPQEGGTLLNGQPISKSHNNTGECHEHQ